MRFTEIIALFLMECSVFYYFCSPKRNRLFVIGTRKKSFDKVINNGNEEQ